MGEQKKRDLETLPEQDLGHEPGSVATTALGQDQKAEASVGDEAKHYLQGFKLYSLVLSLTFAAFLVLLDVAILGTAIPRITTYFGTIADIGWYGSAYVLCNCTVTPLSGKIYTLFSLKYTFVVFLMVFELGSLVSAAASTSPMFIIGRAIAGLGASGLVNGAITIITTIVPLEKRPLLIGIVSSVANIGTILGPVIGGALTEHLSWRWCFYINVPIGGVVGAIILAIAIPEKSRPEVGFKRFQALDLPGFAMLAPTVVMFLLALEWGGQSYRWNSATIIGLFCGSFGLLCVFLAWENHQGDAAMIPLSIVRHRIVTFSGIFTLFIMGHMVVFSYYLPTWFQVVLNATPTMSGVMLLPTILSQILGVVISGLFVSKLGYYIPGAIGGTALAAIGAGLILTFTPSTTTGQLVGYQIINGVGRGLALQTALTATQFVLKGSQTVLGTAMIIFFQYLGASLFISLGATIFTNQLGPALEEFAPEANATLIQHVGAASVRGLVSQAELGAVLLAYNNALLHVFYLALGAVCGAFAVSWGLGWKSVKKGKAVRSEA